MSQPTDASDPLADLEANAIRRMRAYWDQHVNRMDFRYLAEDCARLFAKEYENCWMQPEALSGEAGSEQPPPPCVADADMVYVSALHGAREHAADPEGGDEASVPAAV